MTTKKSSRSSRPRSAQKTTRSPTASRVASNVSYLDDYLKATRHLCDAQRMRHVFINDAVRFIGTDVSKADFDELVRAELNFMIA